jgi:hypothetical protein
MCCSVRIGDASAPIRNSQPRWITASFGELIASGRATFSKRDDVFMRARVQT